MFKKIISSIFILGFFLAIFSTAQAETRITDGYLYEGAHWTKEGSPYILEDYVFLPSWQKLKIDSGVVVMSASTTPGEDPYSISVNSDLEILGTKEEPVTFHNLNYLYLGNSTTTIRYAKLVGTGLDINGSRVEISSSSITHAGSAISIRKSRLKVSGSELVDNQRGLISNLWSSGPILSSIETTEIYGQGGLGNVEGLDLEQNLIEINNSILERNEEFDISNSTSNTIDATDNWWGSSLGPPSSKVIGPVIYSPWKTEDPRGEKICCSNVLFLPGLKASRLYLDKQSLLGTTTNTLWEPNRRRDVQTLYLDSQGQSLEPGVYVEDVIDKALGVKSVYHDFIAMMNGVVADRKINAWLPFAYDWRLNLNTVALKGNQYATTTKSLILEFEKLARSSKTGKVTIVAHSNGGLLAKILGKELEKRGQIGLVDKVVFVGVPQFGTPQAISALLHGDDQAILGGMILNKAIARTLSLNMEGAYGLLPSRAFFDRVVNPIVSIGSSTISSYEKLQDFLIGKIYEREQPKENILDQPAVLSRELLSGAEVNHDSIDRWSFPSSTPTIFLAGWGRYTVSGINYLKDSFELSKTLRGDGTVLSDIAKGDSSETLFFNQALMEKETKNKIEHADILEASAVQGILNKALTSTAGSIVEADLPRYISRSEPDLRDYPWLGALVVSVHSPLDIEVYDDQGGHLGLMPLKEKFTEKADSDLMWLDNSIPGAQYEDLAGHKYVYLPPDNGRNYHVQLKGTGTGTFTFKIQKFNSEMKEIASSIYPDLPVTPLLLASTSVNSLMISPSLKLDFEGDGQIDALAKVSTSSDILLHLSSLRKVILALELKSSLEKKLLTRLDVLEKLARQGKEKQFVKQLHDLGDKVGDVHWQRKNLTAENKEKLASFIDKIINH